MVCTCLYLISTQLSIDLPNHWQSIYASFIYLRLRYNDLFMSIYLSIQLAIHPETYIVQTKSMSRLASATHRTSLKTEYESTMDTDIKLRAALPISARRRQEAAGATGLVATCPVPGPLRNVHHHWGFLVLDTSWHTNDCSGNTFQGEFKCRYWRGSTTPAPFPCGSAATAAELHRLLGSKWLSPSKHVFFFWNLFFLQMFLHSNHSSDSHVLLTFSTVFHSPVVLQHLLLHLDVLIAL